MGGVMLPNDGHGSFFSYLPSEYIVSEENLFAERHRINGIGFTQYLDSKDIYYNRELIERLFHCYINYDKLSHGTQPYDVGTLFDDGIYCGNRNDISIAIKRTADEVLDDCINCINEIIDNGQLEKYDYYSTGIRVGSNAKNKK